MTGLTRVSMDTYIMFRQRSHVLLRASILFFAIHCHIAGVAQTNSGVATQSASSSGPAGSTPTASSIGTTGGTGASGQPTVSEACKTALQNLNAALEAARTLRSTARAGTA